MRVNPIRSYNGLNSAPQKKQVSFGIFREDQDREISKYLKEHKLLRWFSMDPRPYTWECAELYIEDGKLKGRVTDGWKDSSSGRAAQDFLDSRYSVLSSNSEISGLFDFFVDDSPKWDTWDEVHWRG